MDKGTRRHYAARLGQLLQVARDQAGLRQAELAGLLGKPQSFVSKYESGERKLEVGEFLEICRALMLDPAEAVKTLEEELNPKKEGH